MKYKRKNNKVPVLMLIGTTHSGSTLLNLIFDSHSQIAGAGELAQYHRMLMKEGIMCGCGKRLKECEFWQKVFSGIDIKQLRRFCENWIGFLFKTDYFYADRKERFNSADYAEATEKVYRNILAHSGKKIIFDASKTPARAEILLKNPNLEVILVHLTRDGRGVAYSNIKRGRRPFYFMKRWVTNNLKAEIVKMRNRRTKNLFIYYEDFARDPRRIIKYILKQAGLPFEPGMLNFRKKPHHLIGNYSLLFLRKDAEINPDWEWKEKLARKDRILFSILFGWLNFFYKIRPRKY